MRWRHTLTTAWNAEESEPETVDYPHFAPVSSEIFNQLSDLPARYQVPAGTRLLQQGTLPGTVFLICTGLLRLGCLTPSGDEMTLGLRTSGWYAGAAPVLMHAPAVYSVTCVGPCTVSAIPAAEFQAKLLGNARLLRHFLSALCGELTAQGGAQAQLMSCSAEDRLACFLRERTLKHTRWTVVDPLPLLKQMELAQLLAIKPETLSRIIHRREEALQKQGKASLRTGATPAAEDHAQAV